jgi:hypothetical protein
MAGDAQQALDDDFILTNVAEEAVKLERARIARELHDIAAHCVSVMVIQAYAGEKLMTTSEGEASKAFGHIAGASAQAQQEIAHLVALLDRETEAPFAGHLDDALRQLAVGAPAARPQRCCPRRRIHRRTGAPPDRSQKGPGGSQSASPEANGRGTTRVSRRWHPPLDRRLQATVRSGLKKDFQPNGRWFLICGTGDGSAAGGRLALWCRYLGGFGSAGIVGRAEQAIGGRGRGAAIFLSLLITIAAVTGPGEAGADFAGLGGADGGVAGQGYHLRHPPTRRPVAGITG